MYAATGADLLVLDVFEFADRIVGKVNVRRRRAHVAEIDTVLLVLAHEVLGRKFLADLRRHSFGREKARQGHAVCQIEQGRRIRREAERHIGQAVAQRHQTLTRFVDGPAVMLFDLDFAIREFLEKREGRLFDQAGRRGRGRRVR